MQSPPTGGSSAPGRTSKYSRGPPSTKQYVAGLRRQVPLQEGARPVDGAGLQLRRILQGKTVISAFGASEAMSIETWSGCAVTSSGSTSIGVWHDFAKSRDTLYTKSGRMR